MLTPDVIRAQLDRVVASDLFSSAGRHRRLLSYLVERTLASEGNRLKEYVVATEVFDRPDTYDPRLDSIVRVEMRRLRSRLEEYYGGPGATDPVLISIPRGSYTPNFNSRVPRAEGHPVRPTRWAAWALGTAAAVLLGVLSVQPVRPGAGWTAYVPAIVVLPFEPYSSNPDHQLLAGQLTDAVIAELAGLRTVSVASRTSTLQHGQTPPIRELADALEVQFVIEASAIVRNGRLRVVARLVDAAIDRKVWVRIYESETADAAGLAPQIASEAAAFAVEYRSPRGRDG